MTVYLGTLGRMVELYTTPSASVVAEERYSFTTTLEGRRKAQVRPVGRRTWTWSSGFANPTEQGTLAEFTQGAWGNGPFVFVSADAPGINLLSPAAASCDPVEFIPTSGSTVTPIGPMLTPDGWAARSFSKDTNNGMFFGLDMLPILGGQKVTASAYVRGSGGAVRLFWYNAAGASIGSATSTVVAGASDVVRSFVTGMPPSGTVGFRIGTNSAVMQAARPAATWSDVLLPWGDGQGCAKAVVHGSSRSIEMASTDLRGGRYSNLGFTVSEVG